MLRAATVAVALSPAQRQLRLPLPLLLLLLLPLKRFLTWIPLDGDASPGTETDKEASAV
jgi:hypothetical protein